jgi:flagellar basal body rod protein FlgC
MLHAFENGYVKKTNVNLLERMWTKGNITKQDNYWRVQGYNKMTQETSQGQNQHGQ